MKKQYLSGITALALVGFSIAGAKLYSKKNAVNPTSKITKLVYSKKNGNTADICCGEMADGKLIKESVILKNGIKDFTRGSWYGWWNPNCNRVFISTTEAAGASTKTYFTNIN